MPARKEPLSCTSRWSYDRAGNLLWTRTFGYGSFERARGIAETADNNFLVAGYTSSIGSGNKDGWLVKVGPDGSGIWSQTFGGSSCDEMYGIAPAPDGSFLVAGNTSSSGAGGVDCWILKTSLVF